MKPRQRVIQLDTREALPDELPPGVDFRKVETKKTKGSLITTVTERRGRWLHVKTTLKTRRKGRVSRSSRTSVEERTESAIIPFKRILAACKVEPDTDMGPPWREHDGWEHRKESFDTFQNRFDPDADTSYDDMLAHYKACRGYTWNDGYSGVLFIDLDNADAKANYEGMYEYHRGRGASKQVAREMQALWLRDYIDTLVKWYNDGYEWWGVVCEYKGAESSCWGFDDEDYAKTEGSRNIAEDVAYALQQKGYLITGEETDKKKSYRENRIYHIRLNANMQNWRN